VAESVVIMAKPIETIAALVGRRAAIVARGPTARDVMRAAGS
jgi:hypothetical protein